MYTGILHLHVTSVVIFLVIYLVKAFLLLGNRHISLDTFTRKIKIVEMIVSFAFLGTGIYLWANTGNAGTWLYVKVAAVLASIPLAVIGFRKKKKALALLSIVLLLYAYGVAETKSAAFKKGTAQAPASSSEELAGPELGKKTYESYCANCHGDNGALGLSGATDLSTSSLDASARTEAITKGKGVMPPFGNILSEKEIREVSLYIETLKK
jgi:mono/diheme cytochrome c family protein